MAIYTIDDEGTYKGDESLNLSQPNWIVKHLIGIADLSAVRAKKYSDPKDQAHDSLIAIIFALTALEAFINNYFAIVARELEEEEKEKILKMINKKKPWFVKLKEFIEIAYSETLDTKLSCYEEVERFMQLRHKAIHPKADWHTVAIPHITIEGMSDIKPFTSLNYQTACKAIQAVVDLITEVGKLKGLKGNSLGDFQGIWASPSNLPSA